MIATERRHELASAMRAVTGDIVEGSVDPIHLRRLRHLKAHGWELDEVLGLDGTFHPRPLAYVRGFVVEF